MITPGGYTIAVLVFALVSCAHHPTPAQQAAAVACSDTIRQSAAWPPEVAQLRIGQACAAVYSEPACAGAWRDVTDPPPEERVARLIDTCASAYCPSFLRDVPALCFDRSIVNFPAFNQRVLAWELNVPVDEVPAIAPPVPVRIELPPRAAERLQIVVTTNALMVGDASIAISDLTDAHALAASLTSALPATDRPVVLICDPRVDYSRVRLAIAALQAAGVTEVTTSTTAQPEPDHAE